MMEFAAVTIIFGVGFFIGFVLGIVHGEVNK